MMSNTIKYEEITMGRNSNARLYEHKVEAQRLLKSALWERGLTYRDLAALLTVNGQPITKDSLTNKVGRGNFSAGFLVLCLALVGAGITTRPK